MPTRAIYRSSSVKLAASENAAPIYVDSDDNELKLVPGGAGSTAEFVVPLLEATAGAVTQVTSITTGVTLNTSRGAVTTVGSTLGAGLEASFTVTNSEVVAGSVVAVSIGTYAGTGLPAVLATNQAVGSFQITITNLDTAAALNASLVINFAVL